MFGNQNLTVKVAFNVSDMVDFKDIYLQLASMIYNYLLKLCKEPQLAEELLQETFFSVYKNLNSFRGDSSLKSWVYTIATNKFRDHLRKKQGKLVVDSDLLELQPYTANNPEQVVCRDEKIQKVRQAVEDLSPKLRDTFILVRYEGLKYREAAEVLKVSTATVRMRIHRSMKILSQKLGEEENE